MNSIKDNSLARNIAMVVIILMAVGVVFVFSAGVSVEQEFDLSRFYEFPHLRQMMFFPLAGLIMYIASCFNYRKFSMDSGLFKSPTTYILALSAILLAIVLVPRFGTEINYARRWLRIPIGAITISFQPSELAKWSVIFFLAAICDRIGSDIKLYWKRFVPICGVVAVVAGLIITEDLGTAAFILFLSFLMLIIAGVKFWHVLTPLPFCFAAAAAVLIHSPNRMRRIAAFLNPEKWADSTGYQANQSLIAIGSGGLFGKGLGRGICKYGHLPEDTTDFIFSIIAEELGFFGAAAIIVLFIIFALLGIMVIVRCKSRFGQFLAAGIVLSIVGQAALNIGVATAMLPTKGVPLPFVSAGGTSLLLTAAAVGVLINIASQSPKTQIEDEQ
ncbi:MAG: cell division protein FtsW [Planctomycetes bacterium]|nr:cell division protein FtsW [Planctomycetota bacterium]